MVTELITSKHTVKKPKKMKENKMKFKKLQWTNNSNIYDNKERFVFLSANKHELHSVYYITNRIKCERNESYLLQINGKDNGYFDTLELAKQSAQNDFERKVKQLYFEQ
jgi:hypothetical protein